jgi:predicted phosphodiesterase
MSDILELGLIEGPLLVFGGPYGNRQATQSLYHIARRRGIPPARVICTGDVVAYCAEPEPTVQLIRDWGIAVVQGNCEAALAADAADCGCGFAPGSACDVLTETWYPHAARQLSRASKRWMQDLPRAIRFAMQGRSFLVIHGGVTQNNRFLFQSTPVQELRAELAQAGADAVIAGHCGLPFGRPIDDGLWLNAGAIGMPANDGTRAGWYLLLEPAPDAIAISWQRLAYDAQGAFAAMQSAGLANGYADALLSGRWPSMDVLPGDERRRQGVALQVPPLRFAARRAGARDQSKGR